MSNKENYNFADFTLINYKRILKLAKENYLFEIFNSSTAYSKSIILRHDIEFSMPIALQMAKIESELDIKATYFLQLHSEFYNPFDKDSFNMVKDIIESGHHLGLHFDTHFWNINSEQELKKCLLIDKETLERYFDIEIKVFSFHNTNEFILTCEKEKYGGMINVYSKYFKETVGYCADSTGYWRYERLEDRLKEAKDKQLQILIHDGMWQDEILPPRRRVFKVIDDRAEYLKKYYDQVLKKFGANNIDWDKIY